VSERSTKAVFAAMALVAVLAGLAVYLLHARLGIGEDTAQFVSTAFLLAGMGDTLLLYFWDRIFRRRS
jgi:flagellar biosynthesis protein FliQ